MAEEGNVSGGASRSSTLDLYNSMLLGEQELESLNENDDNGGDDEKSNNDASLLSMTMTDGNEEDNSIGLSDQQNPALLKCISCNGVLPSWNNERGDEQSYCLSESEENICFGAVRVRICIIL